MRAGLRNLANAAGFQIVWLAAVAGAANGLPWAGPLAALLFAAAVLAWGGQRTRDLRLLAVALPLGIAIDSAFAASGWLRYVEPGPLPWLAPAWIAALWLGFTLTLNHSLAMLRQHAWLAALFGLIGAPVAYWAAAAAFAAVSFGAPDLLVLSAVGMAWALLLPALYRIDRRVPNPRVATT
ncbi:MAG TPA: DUF2878 domain-containing protein [Arenimonas sp.]|nr:DUF2878 domain-containing protein [Arenimonas sp.]